MANSSTTLQTWVTEASEMGLLKEGRAGRLAQLCVGVVLLVFCTLMSIIPMVVTCYSLRLHVPASPLLLALSTNTLLMSWAVTAVASSTLVHGDCDASATCWGQGVLWSSTPTVTLLLIAGVAVERSVAMKKRKPCITLAGGTVIAALCFLLPRIVDVAAVLTGNVQYECKPELLICLPRNYFQGVNFSVQTICHLVVFILSILTIGSCLIHSCISGNKISDSGSTRNGQIATKKCNVLALVTALVLSVTCVIILHAAPDSSLETNLKTALSRSSLALFLLSLSAVTYTLYRATTSTFSREIKTSFSAFKKSTHLQRRVRLFPSSMSLTAPRTRPEEYDYTLDHELPRGHVPYSPFVEQDADYHGSIASTGTLPRFDHLFAIPSQDDSFTEASQRDSLSRSQQSLHSQHSLHSKHSQHSLHSKHSQHSLHSKHSHHSHYSRRTVIERSPSPDPRCLTPTQSAFRPFPEEYSPLATKAESLRPLQASPQLGENCDVSYFDFADNSRDPQPGSGEDSKEGSQGIAFFEYSDRSQEDASQDLPSFSQDGSTVSVFDFNDHTSDDTLDDVQPKTAAPESTRFSPRYNPQDSLQVEAPSFLVTGSDCLEDPFYGYDDNTDPDFPLAAMENYTAAFYNNLGFVDPLDEFHLSSEDRQIGQNGTVGEGDRKLFNSTYV